MKTFKSVRGSTTTGLAILATFVAGCTTVDRPIETPAGSQIGIFKNMRIIGVLNKETATGNMPGGTLSVYKNVVVEVPVGTEVIVPAVTGWMMGFGKLRPEFEPEWWDPENHHYGLEQVHVRVTEISSPFDGRQTANIQAHFFLADKNPDDKWFGRVSYHLICLAADDGQVFAPAKKAAD